jgi:4-aminobutyrate aminotransferase/(S)-3-amino-2-methylpropionate transaminase
VLEQGATNTTAAVIVEPVQGRAGEVVPPLDFLPGLRALCDAFGVLLIVDEIFTGCGRTGAWFGVDHWNVEPDLVCLGKGLGGGLPISAVVGSAHVLDSWDLPSGPAAHSSTFMAQPLGCAAALATIQELAERGLVERAERLGRQALARLREVAARRPLVGDVRGLGLMLGVELVRNRQTKEPAPELAEQVAWQMHQRGILMLTSGLHGNVLALTPPLVITEKQLDYALAALDEVLGQTEAGASQAP